MKDIGSTAFGLVIAFVIPGLIGFYGLSFISPMVASILATFLTSDANGGLFFLVLAAAIAISLQITVVRYFIFEVAFVKERLEAPFFGELGRSSDRLIAYRALVDETYRFHQFWGGCAVAIPLFGFCWAWNKVPPLSTLAGWGDMLSSPIFWICAVTEVLTFVAARNAYSMYVSRAKQILSISIDPMSQAPGPTVGISAGSIEISSENVTVSSTTATVAAMKPAPK